MSALRFASIALIAWLMTSDGRAQADTDIAAGKIRNWSHGRQALAIMDFEDKSTLRAIATIDAEGQIVMEPIVPRHRNRPSPEPSIHAARIRFRSSMEALG